MQAGAQDYSYVRLSLMSDEGAPAHEDQVTGVNGTFQLSGKVLVGVITAVLVSGLMGLVTVAIWVIEIRSNRFTVEDAMNMETRIMSRIPPREVNIRLDRLQRDLQRMIDSR